MKYIAMVAALASLMLTLPASQAEAWVCYAGSRTGSYGYGWHRYDLYYARRRALAECAVRTPRGFTCYITSCR